MLTAQFLYNKNFFCKPILITNRLKGQKGKMKQMLNEEQELINRLREGDRSAFRKIMETHQEKIYYLALNMAGNHQDAEDLSQEVFIKAYHSLKKFRGDARISSWLYRIAVNTCIDKLRKKKEKPVYISDEQKKMDRDSIRLVGDNPGGNPESRLESGMIQNNINAALQKLSPRERSVFVLRHYDELQIKEIADVLNLSTGTIKSLIFRAIRKLQKELAFYRPDLGLEGSK